MAKARPKLLIVEDNEDFGAILSAWLQRRAIDFHLARSGKDAKALADTNTYDLVLLDLLLPDCDGRSLIEPLRQALGDVPIVALSALATTEERDDCLARRCAAFLPKPCTVQALEETIWNQIRKQDRD